MSLKNQLVFYVILVVIIDLALVVNPLFAVGVVLYLVFLEVVKIKIDYKIAILMVAVVVLAVMARGVHRDFEATVSGRIVEIKENQAVIQTRRTKVLVYFDDAEFTYGDQVELALEPLEQHRYNNENSFDYWDYLDSKGINQVGWLQEVKAVESHYRLGDYLIDRLAPDTIENSYARMFVLGIKDDNIDTASLVDLSIIHLVALSGMHLEYLKKILARPLRLLVSNQRVDLFCYLMIGFYLLNIPENIAFARALGVGLLGYASQNRLTKMDCLALTGLVLIIKNPEVIHNLGFIFSFATYLFILLLQNCKAANVAVFVGTIPIIIATNYRFNLLSVVLAPVLAPLVEGFYLAVLGYTFLSGYFGGLISILVGVFRNVVALMGGFSVFINFARPSLLFIGLYYYQYFRLIMAIKAALSPLKPGLKLGMMTIGYSLLCVFAPYGRVAMIDVGQGDCFLISQPFNRGNVLVDTGGNRNFDLGENVIEPFLRAQGIHRLDCVIITHDDFDHSGSYPSLQKRFDIRRTITEVPDELKIGAVAFNFLKLPQYQDKNDNSLVFQVNLNNQGYLFTGDISTRVEQDIIERYPDLKVDVLKVSHHGSDTATGAQFISHYRPRIALISVGRNNPYHHPAPKVCDTLKSYGVRVYRSDVDGGVLIDYLPDKPNLVHPKLIRSE